MAARWGAGAGKRGLGGGMELYSGGGAGLQSHPLEEDGNCSGISDLGLSSLDTSELLSAFHGYIDPTILSIIEDAGNQMESKNRFDEENELSLLTALTEILDNADDENLSPFDSIPDSELFVSRRDRDNSLQRFLNLSRSPTERNILPVDDRKGFKTHGSIAPIGKIDNLSEDSWDIFQDCLHSAPVRRNKVRSARKCVGRTREVPTLQLSDGEEKVFSPEQDTSSESSLDCADFGLDFSIESLNGGNELKPKTGESKHGTPYIINTENVSLSDLVKYMHSYCLPTRTVCEEPENTEVDEDFLSNGVLLEMEDDDFSLPSFVHHSTPIELSRQIVFKVESVESKVAIGTPILEKEPQVEDDAALQEMEKVVHNQTSLHAKLALGDRILSEEPNSSIRVVHFENEDQASLHEADLDKGLDEPTLQNKSGANETPLQCTETKYQVDELETRVAPLQDAEMEDCSPLQEPRPEVDVGKLSNEPGIVEETPEQCPKPVGDLRFEDGAPLLQVEPEVRVGENTLQDTCGIVDMAPVKHIKNQVEPLLADEAPPQVAEQDGNDLRKETEITEGPLVQHSFEAEDRAPLQDSDIKNQCRQEMRLPQEDYTEPESTKTMPQSSENLPENISLNTAIDSTLTGKRKCHGRKNSKILSNIQNRGEGQNVTKPVEVVPKTPFPAQLQETAASETKLLKIGLHGTSRSSNPYLQESDLLIKQLEQAKRESNMELKSLKASRALKTRARINIESLPGVSSIGKNTIPVKPSETVVSKAEADPSKPTLLNADTTGQSEQILTSNKDPFEVEVKNLDEVKEATSGAPENVNIPISDKVKGDSGAFPLPFTKEPCVEVEEKSILMGEESDPSQSKDIKPKPLSLKEYRMRMQQRKPNAEDERKENETLTTNRWPSLPETPTELAELPCLIKPKISTDSEASAKNKQCQQQRTLDSPASPVLLLSAQIPPVLDHEPSKPLVCLNDSQSIIETPATGVVSQSTLPPRALYAEVPAAPLPPVSSQSVGYTFLPPLHLVAPPAPCVSSTAYRSMPPVMSWPPPFPPPPIGSDPFHNYAPGWGTYLPPPPPPPPPPPQFWPSIPGPPLMQPFMCRDRGPPLHNPAGLPYATNMPSASMKRGELPSISTMNLYAGVPYSTNMPNAYLQRGELLSTNTMNLNGGVPYPSNLQSASMQRSELQSTCTMNLNAGVPYPSNLPSASMQRGELQSTSTMNLNTGVPYPTNMPSALHGVKLSSVNAVNSNTPISHPVEYKTPVSSYQECSNVHQNFQHIVPSQTRQIHPVDGHKRADNAVLGLNLLPQDHRKRESAAHVQAYHNKVNPVPNNMGNQLRNIERPTQQTLNQKVQTVCPPEPAVSSKVNMQTLPTTRQVTKGAILQQADTRSTSEVVLRIFELLRKAQRSAVQGQVVSEPPKRITQEAVALMPLKAHSVQETVPVSMKPRFTHDTPVRLKTPADKDTVMTLEQEPRPAVVLEPRAAGPAVGQEPRPAVGQEPRPAVGQEPRPAVGQEPRPAVGQEPRPAVPAVGQEPRPAVPAVGLEPRPAVPAVGLEPRPVVGLEPRPVVPAAKESAAGMEPRPAVGLEPQAAVPATESAAGQEPRAVVPLVQKLQAVVPTAVRKAQASPKSKTKSCKSVGPKRENIGKEKVIEAADLTSLLEQFEESEAKEEEHRSQSPGGNLAVGNSGFETPAENKPLEAMLVPDLGSTAELTPPATPPHQPLASGTLLGKSNHLNAALQEVTHVSPVKTVKLIEAKPLPPNKLRGRISLPLAVGLPQTPIHVGFGEHDYCFLRVSQSERPPDAKQLTTVKALAHPAVFIEEGSRCNVKHRQTIIIKPILSLTKKPPSEVCQKQDTVTGCPQSSGKRFSCSPLRSMPQDDNVATIDCKDQLDHRTSMTNKSNIDCSTTSVLMSPEASPCNSDGGESRTLERRGNASLAKRSLRCYRKHKDSASLQPTGWKSRRTHASRSCSSSCSNSDSENSSRSSSSSRSRSRSSPPKKRRRYKSRNSHNSRSSSRSSCGSCGRSRGRSSSVSTSYSSRSYSTSYSRSRSRSRSPYSRRRDYYDNRANYRRPRVPQQERAIEERRVVYIGKIPGVMTRADLKQRFSVFGTIEECNIHFRDQGDNYGFVTYRYTEDAFTAIENGHKLRRPDELPFDLCFGGRRQFCKSNYADLDSNRGDYDPAKNKFDSLDFDTLLKQAQKSIRR